MSLYLPKLTDRPVEYTNIIQGILKRPNLAVWGVCHTFGFKIKGLLISEFMNIFVDLILDKRFRPFHYFRHPIKGVQSPKAFI